VREYAPRRIGAVLDDAVALYRANFKSLAFVAACTVFPVALVLGLAEDVYYRSLFSFVASGDPEEMFAPGAFVSSLVIYAAASAMFFARGYFDSAVLSSAGGLLAGARPTGREVLRSGLARWGWYLLAQFVLSIIISFAAIVSFPLLFVGGPIVAVFLLFVPLVTVVERVDLGAAFGRSRTLVRGSFWRVVAYLALAWVLTSAFTGALASPVALGQLIPALRSSDPLGALADVPLWWQVLEGLTIGASTALVAPFTTLAIFSLYVDVRARKEGMDLVIRARALAAGER